MILRRALLLAFLLTSMHAIAAPEPAPAIRVLSSKPNLVTGGSALLSVTAAPGSVKLTVNGADATDVLKPDPNAAGQLIGVVAKLKTGANIVKLEQAGKTVASLTLVNWPITGPVISGPHQKPFICQAQEFSLPDGGKLDPAIDADCSIKPVVSYLYLASGASSLTPMADMSRKPSNLMSTTTLAGVTVPFIVRVETRTVDRGIYQSAVLHDPFTEPEPTPVTPPKGWNRRLIAVEGFGCSGGWYIQGSSMGNISMGGFEFSLLNLGRLGEGYSTFTNTLQHASNNCNALLASEAAMMSKEQFVKTYGMPEFTVSAGCSGGSYGSALLADRIPGLFDGVMLLCTYPDPLSIALSGSDAHLLERFFIETDTVGFTEQQRVAISGYKGLKAFVDAANQCGRIDPITRRIYSGGYPPGSFSHSVPEDIRYDPMKNPKGARATLYDAARNVYGVDARTGFALRPFDNVGVQYGLAALNDQLITPQQFLELNERIGGFDEDANPTEQRSVGNADAIRRAQQAGLQLNGGGGLADIPVFDVTGTYNEDGLYHYQWYHFAVRDRMQIANGNTDNHVMWRGNPVPPAVAWSTFIEWVSTYKADRSARSLHEKAVSAKPRAAVDGCWKDAKTFTKERQTLGHDDKSVCNTLMPSWSFPRHIAGGPVAAHIMKCSLKPVVATDYRVTFTADEIARLKTVFPSGVCDWSKNGSYERVVPDGSFGPSKDSPVYDVSAAR